MQTQSDNYKFNAKLAKKLAETTHEAVDTAAYGIILATLRKRFLV